MIYTKEFLVDAFIWRYTDTLLAYKPERMDAFVNMANNFYDEVGKDKFRTYASLDSEALTKFRLATGY